MITDKIRISLKSGKGGNGAIAFFKDGKPNGGLGGDGGNVVLVGTKRLYDLRPISLEKVYKAENGEMGGENNLTGRGGKDLRMMVPVVTNVIDMNGKVVASITEDGQEVILLKGGRGGVGNYEYRHGQVSTLRKFKPGEKGEEFVGFLELNLYADVIFIGLPNAGKSSMLNALTNASAAVAPYPFTTIQPHLGVTGDLILMDLPGLIEGASKGKGLGTKFTRHTRKARIVAHFISLENENMLAAYKTIREELINIGEGLDEKKEVIILTKRDMFSEKECLAKMKELKKIGREMLCVSAFIYEDSKKMTDFLNAQLS